MSSEAAVRVASLGKSYHLYDRPTDRLRQFLLPRWQRHTGRQVRQYFRPFHALADVSFEITKGEAVGIIGRNGSGKSTLLQLICGTIHPTLGSVATSGRIAALLELGSGFNPEFSGRDNVYMNAALLGLTRDQINDRFDAIASFADIGEHLDQPVRTYSSGMFVRLAFAVIAHVDADILVVDEALAVGDAIFTQRCMRFIRSFLRRGTLLFVSHDPASVRSLCDRAIWLDHGKVREHGGAQEVLQHYLQYTLQEVYGKNLSLERVGSPSQPGSVDSNGADPPRPPNSLTSASADSLPVVDYGSKLSASSQVDSARGFASGVAQVLDVTLKRADGGSDPVLAGGEIVTLRIDAIAFSRIERPILGFLVRDRLGQDLFGENTLVTGEAPTVRPGGRFHATFEFVLPMLPNGHYAVMASVAEGDLQNNVQHHFLHDALVLTVSSSTVRWGLVGVPFRRVEMRLDDE